MNETWMILLTALSTIVALISAIASVKANRKALRAQQRANEIAHQSHELEVESRELEHAYERLSNTVAIQSKDIESLGVVTAQRDLSLSAYSAAIDRLLDLKAAFADEKVTFKAQMETAELTELIPHSMQNDIPQFLLFASGMWKFSYIFSVVKRWEEFGWTENEKAGLENEIKLWLKLPGFHAVYHSHTKRTRAHNPDFLEFLAEVYRDMPDPAESDE